MFLVVISFMKSNCWTGPLDHPVSTPLPSLVAENRCMDDDEHGTVACILVLSMPCICWQSNFFTVATPPTHHQCPVHSAFPAMLHIYPKSLLVIFQGALAPLIEQPDRLRAPKWGKQSWREDLHQGNSLDFMNSLFEDFMPSAPPSWLASDTAAVLYHCGSSRTWTLTSPWRRLSWQIWAREEKTSQRSL